jgi:two-component system response regulator
MSKNILRVLLVEDDDDHADIVARAMANGNIDTPIHRVSTGESALDYLFRRGPYADPDLSPRPNVVLLDLRLPLVDGIEVLRTIKGEPELREIPIIVLTTSDADEDIVAAYQNHANSYLVKPTEFRQITEMADAIRTYWLDLNRSRDERKPESENKKTVNDR